MNDEGYDHICASNLDADHREFALRCGPGEVVDMPVDSCAFCRAGICVQSLADGVVLHLRIGTDGAVVAEVRILAPLLLAIGMSALAWMWGLL